MKNQFVLILAAVALGLMPWLAHATGGAPVVTGGGAVATATGGSVTSSPTIEAAGGAGGTVQATIAGSGGANVRTQMLSLGAPGYAGASQCPVGVIPIIGGTTGAEFCRALWTALITGDRGPVCGNSWFRDGLDDWCADWDARHAKRPSPTGAKWTLEP